MNRTHVILGILGMVSVAAITGAAIYTGVGPAPGGSDAGDPITDFPTATPTTTPTGDGAALATSTPAPPPFDFTIDRIEE